MLNMQTSSLLFTLCHFFKGVGEGQVRDKPGGFKEAAGWFVAGSWQDETIDTNGQEQVEGGLLVSMGDFAFGTNQT